MAIATGRRLGPYEILSAISAGEWQKPIAPRQDRTVAIKVLPGHFCGVLRSARHRQAEPTAHLRAYLVDTSGREKIKN